MKVRDKDALEIREGTRKVPRRPNARDLMGEWPSGAGKGPACEGELSLVGDTQKVRGGAGHRDHRGLKLSQGIWTKSQGKGHGRFLCWEGWAATRGCVGESVLAGTVPSYCRPWARAFLRSHVRAGSGSHLNSSLN